MGRSLVFYYILLTDRLIMLVCKHNYTPSTYYGLAPGTIVSICASRVFVCNLYFLLFCVNELHKAISTFSI